MDWPFLTTARSKQNNGCLDRDLEELGKANRCLANCCRRTSFCWGLCIGDVSLMNETYFDPARWENWAIVVMILMLFAYALVLASKES